MPTDTEILATLASKMTQRGTRPSRTRAGKLTRNRRDWRRVATRYLRRHAGGEWHVGGHQIHRLGFGPGIRERYRGFESYTWVDVGSGCRAPMPR